MEFLITNGHIERKNETNLNHLLTDTEFRLSQKAWYGYGGIPFFYENLAQIKEQAEALALPFPKEFKDEHELFRLTKRMLNKNKLYRSGYVHFQLFWKEKQVQTLITANAFPEFDFPFSETGVLVTFSSLSKNSKSAFNRFPFFNETLWQAGLSEIHQNPFQQVIFLNENDWVCESLHSNIFLIKENELITPALASGCYFDVLRPHILKAAKQAGLNISEPTNFDKTKTLDADEIFVASESVGIQWVLGIENKRFLHDGSKEIYNLLINSLQPNS
ncbi:branched-chain amino acid aminotransferase [Mariniphaga anaerophila]|uniref:Branched-chain amino acid aminotransferase n=1 Tax=Mariniphaga anaerophila TaxID=1484053 RepID=A0A1M4XTI1_9BACT|nr:aminotransferase class IV [Mariniphaga anaerophila]SHE96914.1 branched-chain amino acid aminotransferase [Mariniphaga anaerophila]